MLGPLLPSAANLAESPISTCKASRAPDGHGGIARLTGRRMHTRQLCGSFLIELPTIWRCRLFAVLSGGGMACPCKTQPGLFHESRHYTHPRSSPVRADVPAPVGSELMVLLV